MNEPTLAAIGVWFGFLFPACYFAAHRWLDGAFDHARQHRQNRIAAMIAAPVSLCILLVWLLAT